MSCKQRLFFTGFQGFFVLFLSSTVFLVGCGEVADKKSNESSANPVDVYPNEVAIKNPVQTTEAVANPKSDVDVAREEMNYCKSDRDSIVADMKLLLNKLNYDEVLGYSKKCDYWIEGDVEFKTLSNKAIVGREEKRLNELPKDGFEERISAIRLIVKADPSLKPKYNKQLSALEQLEKASAEKLQAIADAKNSKWKISYDVSPIDDSQTVTLMLYAESSISGWPSKQYDPSLILRCQEKRTDIFVVTGMSPNVEYGTLGATVLLRIDKNPAYKLHASKSTDGEALFLPSAVAQIKKLMNGRELYFQFTPFNSSPQSTVFKIAGLSESIKPLRSACKW